MTHLIPAVRSRLVPLWRGSAPLTVVAFGMLPVLVACAVGLWLDPRTVLGAPVWLKPAKFAASIAVYSGTLAWALAQLPRLSRGVRFVGWLSAVVFGLELLIIGVQAGRGTTSHFNVSTPLNAALYAVMGLAIVTQTLASGVVAVAFWRQTLGDRALGWALRLGLVITIVGASFGGLMTRPTGEQLAELQAGRQSRVVGAHTVGAADGGSGLVGTGWSRERGDVRVPHFLGLHALQTLPLIAVASRRKRWSEAQRSRLVMAAAASYGTLMTILLWQALRGQSVTAPDTRTAAALLVWLAASLVLARRAVGRRAALPAEAALSV